MTLLETVVAFLLFVSTAGAVLDLWFQTTRSVEATQITRHVDDLAEEYAERELSSPSRSGELMTTDYLGHVYTVSVTDEANGGRQVVASSGNIRQALYVSLPEK